MCFPSLSLVSTYSWPSFSPAPQLPGHVLSFVSWLAILLKRNAVPRSNMADSLQSLLVIDHATGLPGRSCHWSSEQPRASHDWAGRFIHRRNAKDWLHLTDPNPAWSPDKLPDSFEPFSSSAGRKQ